MAADGILSSMIDSFEWDNTDGQIPKLKDAKTFGIQVSTLEEWRIRHKEEAVSNYIFQVSGERGVIVNGR